MGVEVDELRSANLLRERGDLLIQRVQNLDEAEVCFTKVCPLPIHFFLFSSFCSNQLWKLGRNASFCSIMTNLSHRHCGLRDAFRMTNVHRTCVSPATSALHISVLPCLIFLGAALCFRVLVSSGSMHVLKAMLLMHVSAHLPRAE